MKKIILLLFTLFILTNTTHAEYQIDGKLEWTWDGSFQPPVRANPGLDYPSMAQANQAFQKEKNNDLTIDWTFYGKHNTPVPDAIFLYACKGGAFDHARHMVLNRHDVVHCYTIFTNADKNKLFAETINFYKLDNENWQMLVQRTYKDPLLD